MKLSTKGRYGLKAMLDLAVNGEKGLVTLKNIAERQDLSENYLEQLFTSLRKADLVKSIRGAQGGYLISKPTNNITVGDILRALEGTLSPVECIEQEGDSKCEKSDICITHNVWKKIRDGINQVVDSVTLEDMVKDYKAQVESNTDKD